MDFDFIAGRPALDFVATVSERGTTDLERLVTPADLADWIRQAGLMDRRPTVTNAELTEAKKLREALYALITALTKQVTPADRDRKLVNAAAASSPPAPSLTRRGHVLRDGDVHSALSTLARDAIDLANSPDLHLVSWCADPTCTRPFVDRSHGHRRRWCGMRGCGDRAKAAAYRHRRSGQGRNTRD